MVYFRAAFGQPNNLTNGYNPPGAPNPRAPGGFMTVFEPTEFAPLWAKMSALRAARQPIVVRVATPPSVPCSRCA